MASTEYSEEKLKGMLRALKDYSNAKIVEIATYVIQFPDPATRKECLRVFCDAIEGLILVSDAPRCLALFYVANEILQRGNDQDFWKAHLGPQLSSFLPRVCAVACQTQEWNVPVNIFRLPHVWRQNQIFPADFCEELSRQCRESYDDCQTAKAPSLPPLLLPSSNQQRAGFDVDHQSSQRSSDASNQPAIRRQAHESFASSAGAHQQALPAGLPSSRRHSAASPIQPDPVSLAREHRGSKSRSKHGGSDPDSARRDVPDDVQEMLSALESEKYLAALHRTQEAVQHIEDLKVKEIAYERMLLEEKIRESAESLRSLHTSRLTQCRTHAETLQVQSRNQAELAAMEKDAREIMDAKLRSWDADLQRWRNTVHLAASQLPPIEESYRLFHAKISGGLLGPAPGAKASSKVTRGDAVAALLREDSKRAPPPVPDDRRWQRMARPGCSGAEDGEAAERRGGVERRGGADGARFHPYSHPVSSQMLNARQSMLRDMALKEAQQQLEHEGVLPVSDLYKPKALSRDWSREDMVEGLERAAAKRPLGSRIPLGLPCSSSGMPLMTSYKSKPEKDLLPGVEAGLVGGWGMGAGGQGGPVGRVTDLWCSQFFASEPSALTGAQLGTLTACSRGRAPGCHEILACVHCASRLERGCRGVTSGCLQDWGPRRNQQAGSPAL
mmetsp:Transcript_8062/g.17205  ORF Transcript_8062/g.17205 Transcript_8062/m.17205 type:complete len:671 (-) Transcript_8062:270-2282(-)